MKTKRHAKILEIIHNNTVTTQEELLNYLTDAGFSVTQATISRDIKELRLIKTLGSNGEYYYSTVQLESEAVISKFHSLFADTVVHIDHAMNIVVVKCLSGMANSACAAIDALRRTDIVGTISGDDTFLCIMKDEEKAMELVSELNKLLR